MIWKRNTPERGATKIVRKFAFLPTRLVREDVTVWLSYYYVKYEWQGYIFDRLAINQFWYPVDYYSKAPTE